MGKRTDAILKNELQDYLPGPSQSNALPAAAFAQWLASAERGVTAQETLAAAPAPTAESSPELQAVPLGSDGSGSE